jgi:transcriptional regulator with XRE-family HTH domain
MSTDKNSGSPDVGPHIKDARRQRQLTLQQLSEASGVSISAISKIENGKASASFDTLLSLCHALDITFEALFGPGQAGPSARRAVTHKMEATRFTTSQYDYEVHAQELSKKRMIPLVMEIKNRVINEETKWSQHTGEEFIYVVSGRLHLHTGSYAPSALTAGDSAYIDSGMPHAFVSVGPKNARIVSVCLDSPSKSAESFVVARTNK